MHCHTLETNDNHNNSDRNSEWCLSPRAAISEQHITQCTCISEKNRRVHKHTCTHLLGPTFSGLLTHGGLISQSQGSNSVAKTTRHITTFCSVFSSHFGRMGPEREMVQWVSWQLRGGKCLVGDRDNSSSFYADAVGVKSRFIQCSWNFYCETWG